MNDRIDERAPKTTRRRDVFGCCRQTINRAIMAMMKKTWRHFIVALLVVSTFFGAAGCVVGMMNYNTPLRMTMPMISSASAAHSDHPIWQNQHAPTACKTCWISQSVESLSASIQILIQPVSEAASLPIVALFVLIAVTRAPPRRFIWHNFIARRRAHHSVVMLR